MTIPRTTEQPGSLAPAASAWSPFRYAAFSVLWLATVVSNIGTWMQNAAAGWMMTGLNPDPLVVSLVQVATSLPMVLFALPAGTLADILDRRRLLLAVQVLATVVVLVLGLLVWLDRMTPPLLLVFTFLVASAAALTAPAWQAIVPQLVPRQELQPAVALNSAGFNVSRAVGPALAGLIIAAWGLAIPFWLNALSNLGVIAALLWWRPPQPRTGELPPERFGAAMRAGLRHAAHNRHLRATLVRTGGFFLFASAYWALLPLLARQQVDGGPQLYGVLLGAIGAGAVGGAMLLPVLKRRLGADGLANAGAIGTALALLMFALARHPTIALCASVIAGMAWIAVLATINVSAQLALPPWVRGRGLAVFAIVQFAALTIGSALWGQLASMLGLPAAHLIAMAGVLLIVPLLRRWRLQTAAELDLMPSLHWPAPLISREIEADRGPVMVMVEYRVEDANRRAFLAAIAALAAERRRDGAYDWNVFEDAAEDGHFVETFLVDSWLEHLRQHERVTIADRVLQEAVHGHVSTPPKVTHLVAARLSEQHPAARGE